MSEFWAKVLGGVIGFAPAAILIYRMGYKDGKKS